MALRAASRRCWAAKICPKASRVEVGEEQAAVDLFVVVDYGVRIPEVAWKIQESVKRAVESMTGLQVVEVNVHVQGVHFMQAEEKPEEPRSGSGNTMRMIDRFVITLAALADAVARNRRSRLSGGWNGTPWAIDIVAAARGSAAP